MVVGGVAAGRDGRVGAGFVDHERFELHESVALGFGFVCFVSFVVEFARLNLARLWVVLWRDGRGGAVFFDHERYERHESLGAGFWVRGVCFCGVGFACLNSVRFWVVLRRGGWRRGGS
ncbi:hypothetical protein FHS27_004990 [Rhodopirellula rubra]|uniref:Transmembrane protein n=1 Tax=Aporhodopirellula rubra TaxID=980271 RepID=A0A7W5H714_9BACT|nr:hypothetical protein [Aporhodopirellula rubra]